MVEPSYSNIFQNNPWYNLLFYIVCFLGVNIILEKLFNNFYEGDFIDAYKRLSNEVTQIINLLNKDVP